MVAPYGYNTADYYNTAAWEPQKNWLFEFIIKGITRETIKEVNAKQKATNNVISELNNISDNDIVLPMILKLAVTDVSLPQLQINTQKVRRSLNKKMAIPTGYSWGNMSLTFLDDCKQDTTAILMNWMNQSIDPMTGEYGKYANFKKKGCLAEYSGSGNIARFWIFDGIFPISFSKGNYSRDGNGVQKISLSLNVDQAAIVGPKDLYKYGFLASMFI